MQLSAWASRDHGCKSVAWDDCVAKVVNRVEKWVDKIARDFEDSHVNLDVFVRVWTCIGMPNFGNEELWMRGQASNGFELLRQLTLEYSIKTRSEALSLRSMFFWKDFFFPALPIEYETLSVNNWKYEWTEMNWMQNFHWKNTQQHKNTTNTTKTPTTAQTNTKPKRHVQWKFAKIMWNKVKPPRAPLSPSMHLFHHVVILQAIHVRFRCPSCQCLHYLAQAGLSHPAPVVDAWAGKRPLWFCHLFAQCSINASIPQHEHLLPCPGKPEEVHSSPKPVVHFDPWSIASNLCIVSTMPGLIEVQVLGRLFPHRDSFDCPPLQPCRKQGN